MCFLLLSGCYAPSFSYPVLSDFRAYISILAALHFSLPVPTPAFSDFPVYICILAAPHFFLPVPTPAFSDFPVPASIPGYFVFLSPAPILVLYDKAIPACFLLLSGCQASPLPYPGPHAFYVYSHAFPDSAAYPGKSCSQKAAAPAAFPDSQAPDEGMSFVRQPSGKLHMPAAAPVYRYDSGILKDIP